MTSHHFTWHFGSRYMLVNLLSTFHYMTFFFFFSPSLSYESAYTFSMAGSFSLASCHVMLSRCAFHPIHPLFFLGLPCGLYLSVFDCVCACCWSFWIRCIKCLSPHNSLIVPGHHCNKISVCVAGFSTLVLLLMSSAVILIPSSDDKYFKAQFSSLMT